MDTATTESTPAPTPTESSATATAVASRPTSALEAFQQVTSTPASEAEASTDPAAIAQDATGTTTEPKAKPKEPPQDKWETILANARTKAETEAMTKWREQFGWAEHVDRSAVEQMQALGQLYQRDRGGYAKQFLTEAMADPDLAPIVRSEAARILGASRQASTSDADPEPDVPVYDGDGKLVNGVFSGKKQLELIASLRSELAELRKQVSPLAQSEGERQKVAKHDADRAEMNTFVSDTYDESTTVLPHFKEHEKEIGEAFGRLTDPATVKNIPTDREGYRKFIERSVRKAWSEVVGPKLDAKAQAKTLDSFKQKAAAQTVDGSGVAASTPTRPRNPQELAAYMRSLAASKG